MTGAAFKKFMRQKVKSIEKAAWDMNDAELEIYLKCSLCIDRPKLKFVKYKIYKGGLIKYGSNLRTLKGCMKQRAVAKERERNVTRAERIRRSRKASAYYNAHKEQRQAKARERYHKLQAMLRQKVSP